MKSYLVLMKWDLQGNDPAWETEKWEALGQFLSQYGETVPLRMSCAYGIQLTEEQFSEVKQSPLVDEIRENKIHKVRK